MHLTYARMRVVLWIQKVNTAIAPLDKLVPKAIPLKIMCDSNGTVVGLACLEMPAVLVGGALLKEKLLVCLLVLGVVRVGLCRTAICLPCAFQPQCLMITHSLSKPCLALNSSYYKSLVFARSHTYNSVNQPMV